MIAPDKIWVEEPEIFDGMGFWQKHRKKSGRILAAGLADESGLWRWFDPIPETRANH